VFFSSFAWRGVRLLRGIDDVQNPSVLAHRVDVDTSCMKAWRESSGFFLWLPPVAAIAFLVLGVLPAVDVRGVPRGVSVLSLWLCFCFGFGFCHLAVSWHPEAVVRWLVVSASSVSMYSPSMRHEHFRIRCRCVGGWQVLRHRARRACWVCPCASWTRGDLPDEVDAQPSPSRR
jgi:hypothetical protein